MSSMYKVAQSATIWYCFVFTQRRELFFISAIYTFTLCVAPLPERKQLKTLSTVFLKLISIPHPMHDRSKTIGNPFDELKQ